MVNDLLDFLLEYKIWTEYNNTEFNADKVQLYEVIRVKMAGKYSEAEESLFGPNYCAAYCAEMRARPRNEFSSCNHTQKSVSGTRASPPDRASSPHVIRPLLLFFLTYFN